MQISQYEGMDMTNSDCAISEKKGM